MGTYKLFDDIETFPDVQFQQDSFQLEEFRTEQFSSMKAELARVIPSCENIHLRHVPLVKRMTKDKARPYVRKPHRKFEGIKQSAQRKLEQTYADLGMDLFLLEASLREAGQNGIMIAPVPARGGRLRLFSFLPGEVMVECDDPLEVDPRYADKVTIRVPLKRNSNHTTFGRLILTQTEAWIEDHTGARTGLWAGQGYGTRNPLGYIPCAVVRSTEPMKGWFWPSLPQAMLSVQIALIIALSDMDMVVRFQAHGKESLIGVGAKLAARGAARVRVGADSIQAFEQQDDSAAGKLEHKFINSNPAIEKYIASINLTLGLLERFEYIGAGSLVSTSITGRGKEFERIEIAEEMNRVEGRWRRAEQQVAWMVADIANLQGLIRVDRPDVIVDYQYVEPRENDLQSTQASILRYFTGRDSPGEQVAREENHDSAEAGWDIVKDRLEKNREVLGDLLGGGDVPGLDSIGKTMRSGGREAGEHRTMEVAS